MALAVKSAVRGQLKGMRAGGDFFKELDNKIACLSSTFHFKIRSVKG
ncbi:MAG: hypothetical protein HYS62_02565 [Candidatus Aenigmarchaeota archaeon]|nr:hypothetical protein [Candidatus Aenigmarchaeota archaeon]